MLNEVEEKKVAYLIGYLAGDGNFCSGKGRRTDRLSVTSVDEEFVDWVNDNIIEFPKDNPKKGCNEKRGIIGKKDSYVKTFPVSYSSDLKRYGVLCLKKDRSIQNIKKKNMVHWLRGFMDADGHFSYSIRRDRNRLAAKAGFTHPSEKLLGQVQTFLMDELEIPSSIKPKNGEDCFVLSFSKLRDVKKFGDFIYANPRDIVVKRKQEVHARMCEVLAERVEQGITFPEEFMKSIEYHSLIGSFSNYMFIDSEGTEYPSTSMIAEAHDIAPSVARRRCVTGAKGWSRRPKTESEKKEYRNYVNRQIKKVYKDWLENNPDYY